MALVSELRQAVLIALVQKVDTAYGMMKSDGVLTPSVALTVNTITVALIDAHNGGSTGLMRAAFELGRLHMALDVIAGDQRDYGIRFQSIHKDFRNSARSWREWASEMSRDLTEI